MHGEPERLSRSGKRGFERKQDSGLAVLERDVASRRLRHGQDSLTDVIEVDFDVGRFGSLGLGRLRLGRFSLWRFCLTCSRIGGVGLDAIGLRSLGCPFFIALGGEWRGFVLAQNYEIDAASH